MVTVTGGKGNAVQDETTFTLPDRTPSVTEADLQAGRVPDRFMVSGNVLPPPPSAGVAGHTHPAGLVTDLTISLDPNGPSGKLTQIYDALTACRKGGWAGTSGVAKAVCGSSTGAYLLGFIPLGGAGRVSGPGASRPTKAVIELLEGTSPTKLTAVDSAQITLPANTTQNNAEAPITIAPDLQG
jgi:hypothetical protein